MTEPFVGEIRMFAGNFAPRGWAFCDGQLLATSTNDALFSLFGTIYGGDGRSTFGLPDLRGRVPIHQGTGPGLSSRKLGSKFGQESVTLTQDQIPSHSHNMQGSANFATTGAPQGRVLAKDASGLPGNTLYDTTANNVTDFKAEAVLSAGGGQPHPNMMPTLCVNFIVALFGIYPSRT